MVGFGRRGRKVGDIDVDIDVWMIEEEKWERENGGWVMRWEIRYGDWEGGGLRVGMMFSVGGSGL